MFWSALIAACFLLAVQGRISVVEHPDDGGEIWAVLVAGSKGWWNYRHQSNICHVYHLLTEKLGVPKRNVITFMYGDIAYNEENPNPGVIINAIHGKDVYEGVVIDYMRGDVNAETFLDVLGGKSIEVGTGKTLKSGPNDMVFVNFVDHGGPGILAFPDDELHLTDLNQALERMYNERRYKQMLWYVEACHSGSMFEYLSPHMNITAHTAAKPNESSWACVKDQNLNVYLSDCWSYNWMNSTQSMLDILGQLTIGRQYEIVKKMTTQSHASIYGDLTYIYNEPMSKFLGNSGEESRTYQEDDRILYHSSFAIAIPDLMMDHLRGKRDRATGEGEISNVNETIRYHIRREKWVQLILKVISDRVPCWPGRGRALHRNQHAIEDPECHKEVLSVFFRECFKMQTHPYITKYLHRLTKYCNYGCNTYYIVRAVLSVC